MIVPMSAIINCLTPTQVSGKLSSGIEEVVQHKYQEVDEVRIIPAKMIFDGAFDGKMYDQSFTISNCGKNKAFVRILAPSSKAFKMKPIPRGQQLSSGMSITRNISYTHISAMALSEATMLIYINEKSVSYQIEVFLNAPFVVLTPNVLDFGEIDVRIPSEHKILQLRNDGGKFAPFSIDLGRSHFGLIVNPTKGVIEPSQVIEISVEILGTNVGAFDQEFWIRTEPPRRVKVKGTLIEPNLTLQHPAPKFKVLIFDFPRTYYGAVINKTALIKNSSSIAAMFCIVIENNVGYDLLESATEMNDEVKCFQITPKEGRLQAQQTYPLGFSFTPKNPASFASKPYKDFALIFLRVVKVPFRDGTIDDDKIKTYQPVTDMELSDQSSAESLESSEFDTELLFDEDLHICLYGEMEIATVKLTPESFYITYLKMNVSQGYELNIKNMSRSLPITVSYRKIACIEIDPKQILLEPKASLEVTLTIKPSRIGPADITVVFDLIYEGELERCKVGTAAVPIHYVATMECPAIQPMFNMGITPKITNEVGFLVEDVRFNSTVSKPIQAVVDKNFRSFNKYNNDLIAFPNDRSKSLRPWKSETPCRTIYANISRYVKKQDEYALNDQERDMKKYTKQLYVNYMRSAANKKQPKTSPNNMLPHYDIVEEQRILMEGVHFPKCTAGTKSVFENKAFLPLTPKKLMNVKITPKYVDLGQLAPYTTCRDSFSISNENDFAIQVSIKALNNAIVIKGKKRLVIKPQTTKEIFFDCWSNGTGSYHVPVYIIVNENHIFDATVFAKVVPTTAICSTDDVVVDLRDKMTCIEIFNPVNCDIKFSWELQDTSFRIYPMEGKIPPKKSLYCCVTFVAQENASSRTEIYLASQSGDKQIVSVMCENRSALIGFHPYLVKFEDVPLNMLISRDLALRNFSDMEISYIIKNPNKMSEITISPTAGIVGPRGDEFFEIKAVFKDVVEFSCAIEFLFQHEFSYTVNVVGNVVYPGISIHPESLQLQKIVSGAYQRRVFQIQNMSKTQCCIDFCLEDYPELFIADGKRNIIEKSVLLESEESKQLFLEFRSTEPVVYSIYMPYVLNGIIGPPALNNPCSVNPTTYFKTKNDDCKVALELPEFIPTMGIRCAASAPWVEISSLNLNFFGNIDSEIFTVQNVSSVDHELAIPLLLDPKCPFKFSVEEANNYEVTHKYHKACIYAGEKIIFKIAFQPYQYGSYDIEVPIFVDKSTEKCPFNYLKLIGTYIKPTILCERKVLFFQTIHITDHTSARVMLDFIAHKENCVINTESKNDTLSVTVNAVEGTNAKYEAEIEFCPKEECNVHSEVIFTCSCDASYNMIVKAGASKCRLLSYKSFMKMRINKSGLEFTSTFPYFPKATTKTPYGIIMNYYVKVLEELLYVQRLISRNFIKIPYGLCTVPVDITPVGKDSRKYGNTTPGLPLVHILTHLLNPNVVKYFTDGSIKPAFDGVEGALYMYVTYRNIISFLKCQKVFLPQLEPEYLLPYNLYNVFRDQIQEEDQQEFEEKFQSQEDFYYFSKQCWVDLIVAMYKVFVFDRIFCPSTGKSKRHSHHDIYNKEFMEYYNKTKDELSDTYDNEVKLLLWVEFHFEKQKSILWDLQIHTHLQKKHTFRCIDFSYSLALSTLLVAYCPYLKNDLQKFYPTEECEEVIFHNACVVYEVVKKIKLREQLIIPKITKLSPLELIIILTYFYDTLPGFYPKETVELSAVLGETAENEINLKNNGDMTIAYTPIFFSTETNDFKVDSDCIIIPPKKHKAVKVSYTARSVVRRTAVLVLSGETDGFKPGKTMAMNLIGNPKIFEYNETYNFTVNPFELVNKTLDIPSPFEMSYEAKLYSYKGEEGKTPESFDDFIPVSRQFSENVPRQIRIDSECTFDDEGFAVLRLDICFIIVGEFSFQFYFINKDVGDFSVEIRITSKLKKDNFMDLEVDIPQFFSTTDDCTCGDKQSTMDTCKTAMKNCSKLILVKIPFTNWHIVEGLSNMFKISTDEQDFMFWNNLLGYPKGCHIFRNRVQNLFAHFNLLYVSVLKPVAKYRIEFSKTKVSFPKTITIENVARDDVYILPLHWNRPNPPEEEILTLYADHNQEIRQYRLIFKPYKKI